MSNRQAYRSWVCLLRNSLLCGLSITPALLVYLILTFMMQMGIVGLPNVGKSTLFNTLGKVSIPAENFPFCTIEPNNVSSTMHSTCTCPGLASGFHSNHCVSANLFTVYAMPHDLWSEFVQARVHVPDERFKWLCSTYKPKSEVPAFLDIVDIAGLVK